MHSWLRGARADRRGQFGETKDSRTRKTGGPSVGFSSVLTLAMGAPPLALYALSSLSPLVVDEFGLTRAQLGLCATVTFVVAATCSAVSGHSVDTLGRRGLTYLLFVGAGLALAIEAASPSFACLLLAVGLSGVTLSLSNPVTNRLVSGHVAPGRQGLLMGVKQSGVPMSQLFVGLLLPSLALLFGWRTAVLTMVSVALLGILLTHRFIPAQEVVQRKQPPIGARVRGLPAQVKWFAAYALISGSALQATNVYLPLFAHEQLDLAVTIAGLSAAVVGGVGLIARVLWGRVSERVGNSEQILAGLGAGSTVATALLLASSLTGWTSLMWLGSIGSGATATAFNVVLMVALVRGNQSGSVGAASGTVAMGLYLGLAIGPACFGLVVDSSGSYAVGWVCAAVAHLMATCLMVGRQLAARGGRAS